MPEQKLSNLSSNVKNKPQTIFWVSGLVSEEIVVIVVSTLKKSVGSRNECLVLLTEYIK